MKALGTLFVVLLIAFAGIHGYLKMEYNTMDACDAALQRVKTDLDSKGIVGKGQSFLIQLGEKFMGSNSFEENLEQEVGFLGCYKIALLGFEAEDLEKAKTTKPAQ